ncbi:MAG: prolyl oligopeptidase family serine peptidase [Acidobacteria bacterium]|nr:prolyl oligopeptidase family serine peptidase [Acidobacteriota bacterium]
MRARHLWLVVLLTLPTLLVPVTAEQNAATAPDRGGANTPRPFELTIDGIMRGPALVGYPPSGLRWSGDSQTLYFEWRTAGEHEPATWAVSKDGTNLRRLSDEERKSAPPDGAVWDRARRRALAAQDGDIVVIDSVTNERRQITRTTDREENPRWTRNDTHVTFTRNNNLFIVPVKSGSIVQLTDVKPKKREARETASQKFLMEEEQKLLEYARQEAERKKKREERQKKDALPEFELEERQAVADAVLSPDDEHAFLLVSERADDAKTADVPTYVTESAYTGSTATRTKVGDAQQRRRLAVLNLETGKRVWADSAFANQGSAKTTTSGNGDSGNEQETGKQTGKSDGREVRWNLPVFPPDGAMAVTTVRSTDNKNRWIVTVDPETGATRAIDELRDEAWVREISAGASPLSVNWLPDGRDIWFLAEHDGWMHLYAADATTPGAKPRALTTGRFEITSATLAPDKTKFYLTSTERHPGERHLYAMPIDGGPRTLVTSLTGSHVVEVSPDESTLAMVYSYTNKPPEVYLRPNHAGAEARQITTSTSGEWRSLAWVDPELIQFRARDGIEVSARLYTPDKMGKRREASRPGVIFVHGAGYLQNAHKYWSTYYREYMFHNLLASRGYVVLDVDYRGSAGYGRDWRTAIYRHMGGKDLDDIVDGAAYLVKAQKVDPARIGVYGGSYGGFITLMAMFTSPDTFAAGAALRPVTDWAHYNHGYTSNILNEPQSDPEAYRRSSPIYFADKLKGALLICHGMVDTNVHFQDSVRLVQRLIELRKENWELAVYPVENHGFEQETSWADEYKRILKLFEQNLRLRKTS